MAEKLICTECGRPAKELYIVRPDEEICEQCLTPEDVARYPEFAAKLRRQADLFVEEAA